MEDSYFLGANSRAGFVSLYRYFASKPGDLLHVIKGGPGTGKSGFMRRIAREALARGLDVETVRCSGDPDSLDGVYVPALRQGWVDGTAPHVIEPAHFGADGDYVELGRFCRLPLEESDRKRVVELYAAYQGHYAAAYRWLAAAAAPAAAGQKALSEKEAEQLRRLARDILPARGGSGREKARFLSAISGQGLLTASVPARCERVYRLEGAASDALRIVAEEAAARGLNRIVCPSPLDPGRYEALLLPEERLAFLSGPLHAENEQLLPTGGMEPAERPDKAALEKAVEALRLAKEGHDALEAVYRPYMDFEVLTAYTEQTLESVFNE